MSAPKILTSIVSAAAIVGSVGFVYAQSSTPTTETPPSAQQPADTSTTPPAAGTSSTPPAAADTSTPRATTSTSPSTDSTMTPAPAPEPQAKADRN